MYPSPSQSEGCCSLHFTTNTPSSYLLILHTPYTSYKCIHPILSPFSLRHLDSYSVFFLYLSISLSLCQHLQSVATWVVHLHQITYTLTYSTRFNNLPKPLVSCY
ncbi:Uncharacterized protein HZ326_10778 [Fusarium oxysporum f. sp. albedinis]|nr:Uncharacterized protein HZ326_10778 [Fusarium oxysporum f. sp. albedinis]